MITGMGVSSLIAGINTEEHEQRPSNPKARKDSLDISAARSVTTLPAVVAWDGLDEFAGAALRRFSEPPSWSDAVE